MENSEAEEKCRNYVFGIQKFIIYFFYCTCSVFNYQVHVIQYKVLHKNWFLHTYLLPWIMKCDDINECCIWQLQTFALYFPIKISFRKSFILGKVYSNIWIYSCSYLDKSNERKHISVQSFPYCLDLCILQLHSSFGYLD